MTKEESLELLFARWPAVETVVRQYASEAAAEAAREDLVVHLVATSAERSDAVCGRSRDRYVFKLDFADYDDHAPRIWLCDPDDPKTLGVGRQFYPNIEGNAVFSHENFLCMPGDRRCYEQGHHAEWKRKEHYHPEVVIGSLIELVRSTTYRGRVA